MATKTKKQVDDLKANWCGDPCWDIEDTEGFEAHREDLLAFRKHMEEQWDVQFQAELRVYADTIGLSGNLRLAQHIRDLGERITELETMEHIQKFRGRA